MNKTKPAHFFNDPAATSEKCEALIEILLENTHEMKAELKQLQALSAPPVQRITELSRTIAWHAYLGLQLIYFKRELKIKEMAVRN